MSTQKSKSSQVKVWDPLVRIFHWSLVFFFLIAFVTEDDWLILHIQAGYAVSLLIAFRLFWGLIGTPNARFKNFIPSPKVAFSYFKDLMSFNAPHYLGHNPIAAVMIISLLLSTALLSFTGLILIAGVEQGPLADTLFSNWNNEWMEEIHEFLANFTLFLIITHVAGVLFSSHMEDENLTKAMLTGQKKNRSDWKDTETR